MNKYTILEEAALTKCMIEYEPIEANSKEEALEKLSEGDYDYKLINYSLEETWDCDVIEYVEPENKTEILTQLEKDIISDAIEDRRESFIDDAETEEQIIANDEILDGILNKLLLIN